MTGQALTPSQWRTMRAIIDDHGDRHLHAGSIEALARRGYVTADRGVARATPHGIAAYERDHRTNR